MSLILLPALAVFAFCIVNTLAFADGDTNWHVATGRWILAHGAVPKVDPFSYTMAGRPWVPHEWLSEVIVALVQAVAGWSGVLLLTSACAAAIFALLAAELRRWLGTLSVIACLGEAFALLRPHLMARPHMLALPLLALWMIALLRARSASRIPSLWLLPMMVLWANLHGSYVFGLAFACLFALEAVVEARGRRLPVALRWAGFLAAAGAAALVTPNGVEGLVLPFRVMAMTTLQSIGEWKAVSFDQVSSLEFAMIFTLFVCLYRGVRMGWASLGLLLLLLHMTLQHIRQEIILAVVAPLLLAAPLGRALEPERAAVGPRPAAWPPLSEIAAPAAVAVALVLGVAAWRLLTPFVRTDSAVVPMTALRHVPPQLAARPVFNDYSFGGWLVLQGVRPFIDGRADMYGDALVQTYIDTATVKSASATDQTLSRYGVVWTILTPTSPLVAHLDHSPGWRRLYADKWAVVQVYDGVPPSQPPVAHATSRAVK